ncbi:MAG: Mut7-C RNAse domain-containing protein [Promethearchaeota archaeon]
MTDFIVDAMLGKVALWLRLAGYDTIYSPDIHDDDLLEHAKNASKVLLTSDLELHERAKNSNVESMLLRGSVDEKVADVFHKYKIDPMIDPSKSRCSKCNGKLTEISKEEKEVVKDLVFEQTFNHYDRFWLCDHCRSVFFQGGQWKNIENYMRRIKELLARRM